MRKIPFFFQSHAPLSTAYAHVWFREEKNMNNSAKDLKNREQKQWMLYVSFGKYLEESIFLNLFNNSNEIANVTSWTNIKTKYGPMFNNIYDENASSLRKDSY